MTLDNKLSPQDIEQIQHENDANARRVLLHGQDTGGNFVPLRVNSDGSLGLDSFLNLDGSNQASWTPSTTIVTNLNADMVDGLHVVTTGAGLANMNAENTWNGAQKFYDLRGIPDSNYFILRPHGGSGLEADSGIGVGSSSSLNDITIVSNGVTAGAFSDSRIDFAVDVTTAFMEFTDGATMSTGNFLFDDNNEAQFGLIGNRIFRSASGIFTMESRAGETILLTSETSIGPGGDIELTAGSGSLGQGGSITLTTGTGSTPGDILIDSQTGQIILRNDSSSDFVFDDTSASGDGLFNFGNLTADRTFTWPNASGTVLLSGSVDISSDTNLAVSSPITLTGDTVGFDFSTNNTWTGTNEFSSNITLSALTDQIHWGSTGDHYIELNATGALVMHNEDGVNAVRLSFSNGTIGGIIFNIDAGSATSIDTIAGAAYDWTFFKNATSGENPLVYQSGYITADTAAKYISWQVDDTTDNFILDREDSNILGFQVNMPIFQINSTTATVGTPVQAPEYYYQEGSFYLQTAAATFSAKTYGIRQSFVEIADVIFDIERPVFGIEGYYSGSSVGGLYVIPYESPGTVRTTTLVSGDGTLFATQYDMSIQSSESYTYLEILNSGGEGKGAFFGMGSATDFEIWNYQGVGEVSGSYPVVFYCGYGSPFVMSIDLNNVTFGNTGKMANDFTLTFGGNVDGVITWWEDEGYWEFSTQIQLPYLGAAPSTLTNGMMWMESDGLHIYYAGAEKVVAGV